MKQKFKCPKCGAVISELTSYQEKDTLGWKLYYQYDVRLYCAECAVRTGIVTSYEVIETPEEKLDKIKEKSESENKKMKPESLRNSQPSVVLDHVNKTPRII